MIGAARKWMWVSLVLTLLLGMGLGVILDEVVRGDRGRDPRSGRSGHEGHSGRFLEKLDQELHLTDAQRTELRARLEANREKARAFRQNVERDYAELRREFRAGIRALLTPPQQARFDAMLAREEKKLEKEHR